MTTCMCKIICVTNRWLCEEDFLTRVEKLAKAKPAAIILREKDLPEAKYRTLAKDVLDICNRYGVRCVLHTFVSVAKELNAPIHLPMSMLREVQDRSLVLGASCHSLAEAIEAEKLGASYITVGHIFNTDCKKGVPGRGTEFVHEVCKNVSIPVYGIGGISADNLRQVLDAGCKGVCIMSGAMTSQDVNKYLAELKSVN